MLRKIKKKQPVTNQRNILDYLNNIPKKQNTNNVNTNNINANINTNINANINTNVNTNVNNNNIIKQ